MGKGAISKDIYSFIEGISRLIIPSGYHPFFRPFKLKLMPYGYRRLSCIWFTSWVCNFRCSYCWQLEESGTYRKKYHFTSKDWLCAWAKVSQGFDEIMIGISGGEPFLMKGFMPMLNSFPGNIKYEITSNLSFDVDEFLSLKNIRRHCLGVVCSFHPSNFKECDNYIKEFFSKVKKLTILRYTRVNFVAAPTNLKFYDAIKSFCDKNDINLHVDRYISLSPGIQFTAQESESAEKIISSDRKQNFRTMRDVLCNGGHAHIAVLPDGSVYPCLKKAELCENLVGNFFSAKFSLNDKWLECSYFPSCAGCDWDNIRTKELEGKD